MIYIKCLIFQDLLGVLSTLQRFYYNASLNEEYKNQVERILKMFEESMDKYSIQEKMKILILMKSSRVFNDKILDFMLYYAEMNIETLNYDDLLLVFSTNMAAKRFTPFELAYKLRNQFNIIYRNLKPPTILKTFGVLCKIRMTFTETFNENIIKYFEQPGVLKEISSNNAVLVLNYYSKIKYRDNEFFNKYLAIIQKDVDPLNEVSLRILLLTLADLNYQDYEIYYLLFQRFNLLNLINEIQKDDISKSEQEYLQAVCDYISSKTSIMSELTVDQSTNV